MGGKYIRAASQGQSWGSRRNVSELAATEGYFHVLWPLQLLVWRGVLGLSTAIFDVWLASQKPMPESVGFAVNLSRSFPFEACVWIQTNIIAKHAVIL